MANEAPDPRAKAIADKILGRAGVDALAADAIAAKARVGVRDAEGKPLPAESDEEPERKSTRRSARERELAEDGSDDAEVPDDGVDEPDEDEGEADDYEEDGDDEEGVSDDDDQDEEDTDDEEDGDDYEEVAYSDDDEVEVTVDGETRTATLRELKKAFSGEGAIEKRLKEATEARKEATAAREAALTEVATHRANLVQTIQQLDKVLFMPLVDEPDPKLRQTNIQQYLMQKDAWEEDVARIAKSREDLQTFFQQQAQETVKARNEFRQEQVKLLVEKMPDIADPVKGPKVNKAILDAAVHYGFTPQQVAQVDNHGLFLMARDASRWLNLQKIKQNGGVVPSGGEKLRRRKRLRSGTATETKTKLVKSAKEQKAAETVARRTGKVDDVTNMLISKAKIQKGPRRGRTG